MYSQTALHIAACQIVHPPETFEYWLTWFEINIIWFIIINKSIKTWRHLKSVLSPFFNYLSTLGLFDLPQPPTWGGMSKYHFTSILLFLFFIFQFLLPFSLSSFIFFFYLFSFPLVYKVGAFFFSVYQLFVSFSYVLLFSLKNTWATRVCFPLSMKVHEVGAYLAWFCLVTKIGLQVLGWQEIKAQILVKEEKDTCRINL